MPHQKKEKKKKRKEKKRICLKTPAYKSGNKQK